MGWIKEIINYLMGKTINELKSKNATLEKKLIEKQEHINRTNAYWKNKMHEKSVKKERV